MTTTARIAATTSPANYDASVASGSVANFGCSGLVGDEVIKILKRDSTGAYDSLNIRGGDGNLRCAELTAGKNTESIAGPIDIRIEKYATANSVEVVEYS